MKHVINLPIYECKVEFHLVETTKDVGELLKKIYKKHKEDFKDCKEETGYGMVARTLDVYYMLVSKERNYKNTFFHELYHLIDHITEDRNIDGKEEKAYLQGYIGEKLLKFI